MEGIMGMENIFKGFDMEKMRERLQEAGIEGSERLMSLSEFFAKAVDQGYYGHGNIVFLEKMVEQIKVLGDYFFDRTEDRNILFIDIETLSAYTDWLQKLIWHLDGLQSVFKRNNLVKEISDIQMRISYFMVNTVLHICSIGKLLRVGFLEQTMLDYFFVIEQIDAFHQGTLEDLRGILEQAKDIID